jgi:hypothetical protein
MELKIALQINIYNTKYVHEFRKDYDEYRDE